MPSPFAGFSDQQLQDAYSRAFNTGDPTRTPDWYFDRQNYGYDTNTMQQSVGQRYLDALGLSANDRYIGEFGRQLTGLSGVARARQAATGQVPTGTDWGTIGELFRPGSAPGTGRSFAGDWLGGNLSGGQSARDLASQIVANSRQAQAAGTGTGMPGEGYFAMLNDPSLFGGLRTLSARQMGGVGQSYYDKLLGNLSERFTQAVPGETLGSIYDQLGLGPYFGGGRQPNWSAPPPTTTPAPGQGGQPATTAALEAQIGASGLPDWIHNQVRAAYQAAGGNQAVFAQAIEGLLGQSGLPDWLHDQVRAAFGLPRYAAYQPPPTTTGVGVTPILPGAGPVGQGGLPPLGPAPGTDIGAYPPVTGASPLPGPYDNEGASYRLGPLDQPGTGSSGQQAKAGSSAESYAGFRQQYVAWYQQAYGQPPSEVEIATAYASGGYPVNRQ